MRTENTYGGLRGQKGTKDEQRGERNLRKNISSHRHCVTAGEPRIKAQGGAPQPTVHKGGTTSDRSRRDVRELAVVAKAEFSGVREGRKTQGEWTGGRFYNMNTKRGKVRSGGGPG